MDPVDERHSRTGAGNFSAPVSSWAPPLQLPQDPKEAEDFFNALPVQSQLTFLLQARKKNRLQLLLLSRNPEALVRELPELEIFLTLREIGEKDALPLISLTTPEQFQFLLDLDLWHRDELNPEKVLHWIGILLECGEKKLAQFIHATDTDSLALLLKKFLQVYTLEGEPVEVMDQAPPFTLDQYYFLQFKGKGSREILEPFIKILSLISPEEYRRLMEALISELEADLEENGYRFRTVRLAEHGFPEFEEALEIYRFIPPDSVSLKDRTRPIDLYGESEKSRPMFYLTFVEEGPFLSSVLARIDRPLEQDRLKIELTALCNRVLVAEAADLSKMEEIERISRRVFHYLNLGLQYLSGREEARGLEMLLSLPLQRIFQCGVSLTLLLRKKAQTLLQGSWFEGERKNLFLLDPPYLERLEGVLEKRPSLHGGGKIEDFKSLQEIEETEDLIETVETLVNVLDRHLGLSPRSLRALDLRGCHPGDWSQLTLSTLFLTALANQVLKGSFRFEAIMKAHLTDLFSRLFLGDEQGKGVLNVEIRSGFKNWIESMESDENRKNQLLAFQDFCLDLLEEQFGKFTSGEAVDPRFVKGFLIRE